MKAFRALALGLQKTINATGLLDGLEAAALAGKPPEPPPPIFILGCPRSGTTLLYELLTGHWRTAYVTNLASLFYRAPALATRLSLPVLGRHVPVYKSELGYVDGLMAPSEAGALTRHWFTGRRALAEFRPERLRRTVRALSDSFGGPLVHKNLHLDDGLERVLAAFPDLLVLRVRRDPRFVVQSILEARRKESGSTAEWLGPRPPGWEAVAGLAPLDQVIWQVHALTERLDGLLGRADMRAKVMDVDYAELCAQPEAVCGRIAAAYQAVAGAPLVQLSPTPPGFQPSERIKLKPEEWRQVQDSFRSAP